MGSTASGATTFITPCTRCSPGRSFGYYADFGAAGNSRDALREPFVYDGQFSHSAAVGTAGSRTACRGDDSSSRFRIMIRSVIAPRGDRLSSSCRRTTPARGGAAALSPYVPLMFMGRGVRRDESIPVLRQPRRSDACRGRALGTAAEFESFGWGDDIPDPPIGGTFHRSKLDRARAARPEHAAVYRSIATCSRFVARSRCSVPTERRSRWSRRTARADHDTPPAARHGSRAAAGCSRSSTAPVRRVEVVLPDGSDGRWTLRLTTDAVGYGGEARTVGEIGGEEVAVGAARDAWSASGQALAALVTATSRAALLGAESTPRRTVTMPPSSAAVYIRS